MTAPFQRGDLVRVDYAEHTGRWGRVTHVCDYRNSPDRPVDGVDFIVHVTLMTCRNKALVPLLPTPVPFEPCELAPLFDASGCWVRSGRVVSRRNWPRQRPEALA